MYGRAQSTVFSCVTLERDLLSSVICPNLPNLSSVLPVVKYVGCLRGSDKYCIGYRNYPCTIHIFMYIFKFIYFKCLFMFIF
jgi:hypothetical protein